MRWVTVLAPVLAPAISSCGMTAAGHPADAEAQPTQARVADDSPNLTELQAAAVRQECSMFPEHGEDWDKCIQRHLSQLTATDPLAGLPEFQARAIHQECSMFPEFGGDWTDCVRRHRSQLTATNPLVGLPDIQARAVRQECSMFPEFGGDWTDCVRRHRSQLTATNPLVGLPDIQARAVRQECSMFPEFGGDWTDCIRRCRAQLQDGSFVRGYAPAPVGTGPAAPRSYAPIRRSSGRPAYEVEAASNDERFVIDGDVYEAKTYCFGLEAGDTVIFVEGSPGVCVTAKLFVLGSGSICDVWCE